MHLRHKFVTNQQKLVNDMIVFVHVYNFKPDHCEINLDFWLPHIVHSDSILNLPLIFTIHELALSVNFLHTKQ